MYNTSEAYKAAISKSTRESRLHGTITLISGITIPFTSADILGGTFSIDNACVSGQELALGAVYAGQVQFSIKTNIDRYMLYGAQVRVAYSLKLADETWEDVPLGVFDISEAKRTGSYVAVKGYDKMLDLDVPLGEVTTGTPYELLSYAATVCGLELEQTQEEIDALSPGEIVDGAFAPFHYGIPEENSLNTFRDLVSEIAVIIGGFATIGRTGGLALRRIGVVQNITITDRQRKNAQIYDYVCRYSGVTCDAGGEIVESGTAENIVLELGRVDLLAKGLDVFKQATVDHIYNCISGLTYTPAEIEYIGDPALDLGDVVMVSGYNTDDVNGTRVCIMSYAFQFHGTHKLVAVGKNIKLIGAKNIIDKTTSGIITSVEGAKSKVINYSNASRITVGSTFASVASLDIPTTGQTSVMLNGQMVVFVETPGTIELQYQINGTVVAFAPKQVAPASGYYMLTIVYNLVNLKPSSANTFDVSIKSTDGTGYIDAGQCILAVSGSNLVAASEWTGRLDFEDEINEITISPVSTAALCRDELTVRTWQPEHPTFEENCVMPTICCVSFGFVTDEITTELNDAEMTE